MYERVRRYFGEMGIGEGVMSALIATPATSIHWFSPTDLQNTRLATDLVNGEKLLAGLGTAAPPIPSVTTPVGASQSFSPAEDALKKDADKLKAECGSAGGILIACPSGPVGVGEVAK
jgi:hypothetical protein